MRLCGQIWFVAALLSVVGLLSQSFLIVGLFWAAAHSYTAFKAARMLSDAPPGSVLQAAALSFVALAILVGCVYAFMLFFLQFLVAGALLSAYAGSVVAATWFAPRALAGLLHASWVPADPFLKRLVPHSYGGVAMVLIGWANIALLQDQNAFQDAASTLIIGILALVVYTLMLCPALAFAAAMTGGHFVSFEADASENA